ncbi:MAG: hypothetical protein GFH27_549291n214 [Chloroflexi bacterium AL-W]|nr:hypothetical protein [Chloroflexi bacterium AL-N1]NOK67318.1 hypothetical protein [Chloroflexi bacterium AL-N10]NOK75188.1 hypothetical protein [Chloroflexi bacterium AL-N5]NOK81976.1 hypothetical protein [Chloroflexi bacterium AL-W]NOK89821.1 hypothetical protein [Chloroflexi bacterium AL-N15]
MWLGNYHNDAVPQRFIIIRDIVTACIILGAAVIIVWYAIMQQSGTISVDSTIETGVQETPLQHGVGESRQLRAVVYVAYPCAACQELLSALMVGVEEASETVPPNQRSYRPVHLATHASKQAAYALHCAQEQAMFEAYYVALPEPSNVAHTSVWQDTAQQAGLDQTAFVACLESKQTAAQVAVYTDIMHSQGVTTPPVVELTSLLTDAIDPTEIMQFTQRK